MLVVPFLPLLFLWTSTSFVASQTAVTLLEDFEAIVIEIPASCTSECTNFSTAFENTFADSTCYRTDSGVAGCACSTSILFGLETCVACMTSSGVTDASTTYADIQSTCTVLTSSSGSTSKSSSSPTTPITGAQNSAIKSAGTTTSSADSSAVTLLSFKFIATPVAGKTFEIEPFGGVPPYKVQVYEGTTVLAEEDNMMSGEHFKWKVTLDAYATFMLVITDSQGQTDTSSALVVDTPHSTSHSIPVGAIAGGVVGGVLLLVGIVVSFLFWRRSRQRNAKEVEYTPPMSALPLENQGNLNIWGEVVPGNEVVAPSTSGGSGVQSGRSSAFGMDMVQRRGEGD